MYRHSLFLLICLLALLATGCRKNEFKLNFALPADVSTNYDIAFYASDPEKGMIREEVAVTRDGKGEYKGMVYHPMLVYISHGSSEPAIAYVERGSTLTAEGENSLPAFWKITGNNITEELADWRRKNKNAIQTKDTIAINKAVAAFVKKNPENPVATLLLLLYFDRGKDETGFTKLWDSLRGEAKEEKWSGLVNRADMIGGLRIPDAKVGALIFRGEGGRRDTIIPGNGSTLLCFLGEPSPDRKSIVEKLKQRIKTRKDSAKSVIVVIGFPTDSITWRYQFRRDSLKGVVNAWMPLGYSDSLAMRLGVRSLPALFEVDSLGRVRRLSKLP